VAFVLAEEQACLSNVANKVEGQKVLFVDDLVELEGTRFVKIRPREPIAHLCDDATRQVPGGRHLQPRVGCGSSQEDQRISCNGRLLDLFSREVCRKPDRTSCRQRRFAQRRKAGLIQQRPGGLDAAEPTPDGWILQHAGSYHRPTLM
jgi:hypothetical protein